MGNSTSRATQWDIMELAFEAEQDPAWWETPLRVEFRNGDTVLDLAGYWDGGKIWTVRFAPTVPGIWRWNARSADAGLNGRRGTIECAPATESDIARNANYRGHIGLSANGRYFQYADGTPFFLLANTVWAVNTARCGLGSNGDGPFHTLLNDCRAKRFTAILMQCMRGFGDTTTEPAGQRNEGGYPFADDDVRKLNPAYFQWLDRRMRAIWDAGMILAVPPTWWGKTGNCFFSHDWAKRISVHLARRCGAYNAIWSVSGEYSGAMRDCGWTKADIDDLGRTVRADNPYGHPLSIHPGGGGQSPPPYAYAGPTPSSLPDGNHASPTHKVQSSRPFHVSGWLDHNWLQTGHAPDRLHNVVGRIGENRALAPTRPVFLSEAFYEGNQGASSYQVRWQAWCAFLEGAAGYGYGAFGLWQFFDPDDPEGETGKNVRAPLRWREAMALEGSGMMRHVRAFFERCEWWRLEPHRNWLTVDGRPNGLPTADDISPPACAAVPEALCVVYVPRGNARTAIELVGLPRQPRQARWYDPRTGDSLAADTPPPDATQWRLPARPTDEDWVLCVERAG
ncbi:MAG: DUF4038 domain-containing protein [Kiritimatiellae bacterium]|nr:DUF4038 domain-containing protein [Kiritimatiellia bacterium]